MHKKVIKETEDYVRKTLEGEGTGHDWGHIYRVWNLSKYIQKQEGGNLYIVELASLLHDIADWKFYGGDDSVGPKKARGFLKDQKVADNIIDHVCEIILKVSFKGADVPNLINTIEGKIVQDADRLDAIGAIGIARCFAYGGYKERPLYHPNIEPVLHKSSEAYKNHEGTTINHFYEKLLLLKDRMNTETAKKIAEKRHKFMEKYLDQFFEEWNCK